MKLFMPKQHGAWAMLILPFWLGAAASDIIWSHIPFFLGWILLYLATYPGLLLFKRKRMALYAKWTAIYLLPAILLLLIPLLDRPSIIIFGLLMIPFFIINALYSSKNRDRALGNDFSAICAFSIAGLASSYLPHGEISMMAWTVFTASILFFAGSTFYVKSMIREKKNRSFKWISWIFHAAVPILWLLAGGWIISAAFIPSLFRSIAFYGRSFSPKKIGIYEIANASIFFLMLLFSIHT
ncbi:MULTISPECIES: YwiC-like family protein [unclassified Cytobacillus]|uniref:YwiC-like family protein n=1 Tax=unclassified Cytobacillus TaxID=2675268 RepID=UPI00135BEA34|nr:YwiC-like family protein [Cytobacillus sp. AMY 15.2]KAF0816888.1 putative membrane protein YwiC [Bacillus sp. ZZV12-4809]MCM3090095.1 YwiC-like family protein [Cytobacillus sp. AMY 15.2]